MVVIVIGGRTLRQRLGSLCQLQAIFATAVPGLQSCSANQLPWWAH